MIPTRIELRAGPDGPACSFTAHLPFCIQPLPTHKILFEAGERYDTTILSVYHFMPGNEEPTCLVITVPIVADDYDKMLLTLDWFKANYQVEDFKGDRDSPEPYYSYYRTLVHVLGVKDNPHPLIQYDSESIKIFSECCRAVILAEINPQPEELARAIIQYNPIVEALHGMILSRKRAEPQGAEMLAVVKELDKLINQGGKIAWVAPIERCVDHAKVLFSKLPSIAVDRLPKPIGAHP